MTWANQVRILKQNFEQLGAVVGGTLINAFKPLVQALNSAMGNLIAFAETVSNALGKIFGWKFEKGSGGAGTTGLATDMEDAADSAGGLADNTGQAAKNIDKMKAGLRAFDELKTITLPDSNSGSGGGSGSSGSSGGASGASGSGGQWVKQDSIFDDYKSSIDSLYGLGEYIRKTLVKEVGGIKWETVYEKASRFGSGLAEFLNGLFSSDKKGNNVFTATADVIAGALNTALHTLDSFGETFEWDNFGDGLARGCKRFFKKWDAKLSGSTFSTFVNGLLKSIVSFVGTLNDDDAWGTIVQRFVDFIAAVDFKEISINLSKLAAELAEAAGKAVDAISDKDVWTTIGQKLADFICGIDWSDITFNFGEFWSALTTALIDWPRDLAEGFATGLIENLFGEDAANSAKKAIDGFKDSLLGKAMNKFSLQMIIDSVPAFKTIQNFFNAIGAAKSLNDFAKAFSSLNTDDKKNNGIEDEEGKISILDVIAVFAGWEKGKGFKDNIEDMAANFAKWSLEKNFGKTISGMIVKFVSWVKDSKFGKTVSDMIAKFKGWEKSPEFEKIVSGMKAKFANWILSDSFGLKIPGMIAKLARWIFGDGFKKTISGMVAELSKWRKNKSFSMNITGFTANLSKYADSIIGRKTLGGFTANIVSFTNKIANKALDFVANIIGTKGKADGGVFSNGSWKPIQRYAAGGIPDYGQLFWAREAGPELVGTLGGHTAVMNNDQIVASVSAGVYQAVTAAIGNNKGASGNIHLTVNLDGKVVYDNVRSRATDYFNRTGKPAFPI